MAFELRNDHIVARLEDGRLALLDTGAPLSLAPGTFEFGWESHRPFMPIPDAASLTSQIGAPIDVLVGMDVLRTLCLAIDWELGQLDVLPGAPMTSGIPIPMGSTMGELPFVPTEFEGKAGHWIIDTGARVSFVKEWRSSGADEPWEDFVLQGEVRSFREPSRISEITLGGRSRRGRAVRLPNSLALALELAKADGIVGIDWMKQSPLILDFVNGQMVATD